MRNGGKMAEWEKIIPKVNESAEFLEIASDFGDPLELFEKHCIMHTIGEQQNSILSSQ